MKYSIQQYLYGCTVAISYRRYCTVRMIESVPSYRRTVVHITTLLYPVLYRYPGTRVQYPGMIVLPYDYSTLDVGQSSSTQHHLPFIFWITRAFKVYEE